MPRRAVRLGFAGQRGEIVEDRINARLLGIGAVAVGAAAVAVLRVPVVGSWLRIWVLDLIDWGRGGVPMAVGIIIVVGRGLMVIVADRICLGELREIGHV